MSISNSRLSYEDCYKIMDAALEDKIGARVKMADNDAAVFLRMRIHTARSIDRRDNTKVFEEGHPLYGRSPYDKLVTRIRKIDEDIWIYVEQIGADLGEVEPLSGPPQLEGPPAPLQIEYVRRRL